MARIPLIAVTLMELLVGDVEGPLHGTIPDPRWMGTTIPSGPMTSASSGMKT